MTNFGKWIKLLPDLKVALGIVILSLTTVFSLGLGTAGLMTNMKSVPSRLDSLEVGVDTLFSTIDGLSTLVERHIERDSLATWRIYCVVNSIAEQVPVGPLDCDRVLGRD